jgi:hypothetical protein
MKVAILGINQRDRFVHRIAPSYLVDLAYVEEVRDDGAVVMYFDSPEMISSQADQVWFREVLVELLKAHGEQTSDVSLQFF